MISKYALFLNLYIEKAILFGKTLKYISHVITTAPYLVANFEEEALLIV